MKRRITVTIERVRRIIVRQSRSPTDSDEAPFDERDGNPQKAVITVLSTKPALPAGGAGTNQSEKKGESS